uniref:Nucleoporin 188 n=1 Tax=Eptatretus burgeri TaxID=7764 RepID=A0A8C4N615_EPTBU
LQLELLFLFFTYFEMAPRHLLCLAQLFCRIRFGLAGFTASPELDSVMVRLGIVSAHGPVLLAWAVLRHAALDDMGRAQTQHLGKTAIQLQTMHFLSDLLQDPGFSGTTNCTARTARGCIYDFLSCHLMNLACEVLVDPNLAENFWDTDPMDGLGVLLQSACTWFPLQLTPLLHLLTSLVCNRSTAKRVYSFFSQLENFAEGVTTRPRGMDVTEDENVWRIRATRLLYPLGAGQTNLRMPAGTEGVLLESVPGLNQRIIWSFPYSGWTLCTCELEFTHHVVSTADILQQSERVRPIVELVRKVVSTDSSLAVALLPLTSRLYPLLQRLACVPNPPVGVVSSCLACLATLAPHNPHKVRICMSMWQFFVLNSGEGLHPGNFGQFLVSYERPQGEFKVTLSFLKLVSALTKVRARITSGRVCLDLLHHVLNCGSHDTRYLHCTLPVAPFCPINLAATDNQTTWFMYSHMCSDTGLHSLCLNALLHTEAGATLASLAAIGPSALDAALSIQPSSLEGPGIQLVQQVKLALSLANNSLRLKPPGPLCALELALIHPQGACSVLAVLAQYVHHRFDPGLPRMAILLLKRLSTAAPMSVTACLGHKASAIRDAFVARLLEPTEDTRMKATILEFMAVSVETQPGLIELFLDLRAGDTGGVSVGKWSCVPAVLALVSGKGGGAKYVPPVLHCAALGFLHALWHDRRDGVTSLLRDRFLTPLSKHSHFPQMNILQACAFILKIVSLEIYYMQRYVQKLFELRRYEHWSMYMRDMAKGVASLECAGENVPEEVALFTAAWRTFLMLATTHVTQCNRSYNTKICAGRQNFPPCMCVIPCWFKKLLLFLASCATIFYKSCDATIQGFTLPLSCCNDISTLPPNNLLPFSLCALHSHLASYSPFLLFLVCVASLCLVQAICNVHSNGEEAQSRGLGVVRDSGLLHSLLGALECALAYRVQLHFSLSALDLFLTVAASSQGADMLAAAGVASCICLPLLNTYKTDGVLTTPQLSSANPSWESVYQLSLALLGMLLRKLRHRFLPHAFDFLGVHQDRVLQVGLNASLLHPKFYNVIRLPLNSCAFALRFIFLHNQMSLCYLCQTCTSLLHRPELLQHYLQVMIQTLVFITFFSSSLFFTVSGCYDFIPFPPLLPQAPRKGVVSAGGLYVVRAAEGRRAGELEKMRVSVGSSKEKEHGRGREREQAGRLGKECEQDAKGLAKVQSSLVRVLAWSLGTLRSFSPDISQLLLDTVRAVAFSGVLLPSPKERALHLGPFVCMSVCPHRT